MGGGRTWCHRPREEAEIEDLQPIRPDRLRTSRFRAPSRRTERVVPSLMPTRATDRSRPPPTPTSASSLAQSTHGIDPKAPLKTHGARSDLCRHGRAHASENPKPLEPESFALGALHPDEVGTDFREEDRSPQGAL